MRGRSILSWVLALGLAELLPAAVAARNSETPEPGQTTTAPPELEGVGVDEHPDAQIPLDLVFHNEDDQEVRLAITSTWAAR